MSFITPLWHLSHVFLITLTDSLIWINAGRSVRKRPFMALQISNLSNFLLECNWRLEETIIPCTRISPNLAVLSLVKDDFFFKLIKLFILHKFWVIGYKVIIKVIVLRNMCLCRFAEEKVAKRF